MQYRQGIDQNLYNENNSMLVTYSGHVTKAINLKRAYSNYLLGKYFNNFAKISFFYWVHHRFG